MANWKFNKSWVYDAPRKNRTNRFSVIRRHRVIKNFDSFWQFIDVSTERATNENNQKNGGEKIQRCDSSKFLTCTNCEKWTNVCPSAISMSSSVAAVPSSTPWRDNLINWKSGDLFFLQLYPPPYPSHKNPIQPRGLLMFAAHGVIKWSFFASTRVALK